jgi:3',5'-cyclic AMP phosphodiesterase CpdA
LTTLLHISDTHFGTEQAAVVDALLQLSKDLAPDLVVLSGDVTQRARPRQFAAARRFLDALGVPFISIAGNHDIPLYNGFARLLFPYANYQREFGTVMAPIHDSAGLLVLGVKTTRRYRHAVGEVSPTQVDQVAAALKNAQPEQLRVVVVHQPLHVEGGAELRHRLRGSDAALAAWAAAGADIALGGHIHLPYVRELWPGRSRGVAGARIVVAQAGTALSNRLRHGMPNSVNVIRHDTVAAGTCTVERWDCAAPSASDGASFQRVDVQRFALDRGAATTGAAATAAAT